MTPHEFNKVRIGLDFTRDELARDLGITEEEVLTLETQSDPIPKLIVNAMHHVCNMEIYSELMRGIKYDEDEESWRKG